MATRNPTTHRDTTQTAAHTLSEFEAQARQDGWLDADGYFVGPPDVFEINLTDVQRPAAPLQFECLPTES